MAKRPTIEVTAEDIVRGARSQSAKCMIAAAVKRAIPTASKVMVDIQTIRYTDTKTGERVAWLTPPAVQALIVAFDAGELARCKQLAPVRFQLRKEWGMRIQRTVPKTPKDRAKKAAALRARRTGGNRSEAGVKTKVDTPAGPNVVGSRHRPPRSKGTTNRIYGSRGLHINQARVRVGDIPARPEPVPGL